MTPMNVKSVWNQKYLKLAHSNLLKCVLPPQNIACHTITVCPSGLKLFCKCGNHEFNVLHPSRYDPKVRYRGKLIKEKLAPQLHQSGFDHVGHTANGEKLSTIQCKFEGLCLSLTDIYVFLSIFNKTEPLGHSKGGLSKLSR